MKRKMFVVVLLCLMGLVWSSFGSEEQDIESLIKQLEDKDEEVTRVAVDGLSEIGESAVPALIQALAGNWRVSRHVADALVKIGKPAVPVLVEALRDEDKTVRYEAAEVLSKIGEPAVPALIEALSSLTNYT